MAQSDVQGIREDINNLHKKIDKQNTAIIEKLDRYHEAQVKKNENFLVKITTLEQRAYPCHELATHLDGAEKQKDRFWQIAARVIAYVIIAAVAAYFGAKEASNDRTGKNDGRDRDSVGGNVSDNLSPVRM